MLASDWHNESPVHGHNKHTPVIHIYLFCFLQLELAGMETAQGF